MSYQTLISASDLRALIDSGKHVVILDCGFDLSDLSAGERAHAVGHLPGAHYAHLDRDLAGAKSGRNGRHPLPERDDLAQTAGHWGVAPGVQVVCYDDQGGPYAARAWWLLRWMGHSAVAVLDGGRAAWAGAGGTLVQDGPGNKPLAPYPELAPAMPTIDADALHSRLGAVSLIDARAGERFRGEIEPLDPVAGHIPGAFSRFFKSNLDSDARFKPPELLRQEFAALGATGEVVHQCGSGVTACHNLLAMAHAGMDAGALYPGSWSEWCSDPQRPVARA